MADQLPTFPVAEIAEKALISCLFAEPHRFFPAFESAGITSESFYLHRGFFEEITAHYRAHGDLDISALAQALNSNNRLERFGGVAEITEIAFYSNTTRASHIDSSGNEVVRNGTAGWRQWARQLKEAEALRISIQAGIEAIKPGKSPEEAVDLLQDAVESMQRAIRPPATSHGPKSCAQAFIQSWKTAYDSGDMPGDPTGYQHLDAISGGMRKGQLIVVGGRESAGKSVILYEIAARKIFDGKVVSIHSLEMGREEVVGRMLAAHGSLRYEAINKPRGATKAELPKISRLATEIMSMRFCIDDRGGQTIEDIIAAANRVRDEFGELDLVIVDYIQLIDSKPRRGETRESEVARASRSLKQLAKVLGCPVITATQLNSDGESRESKAIQQDADWLLYITNDGLRIVKMRNARRGDLLPLVLKGETQQFVERTWTPESPQTKKTRRYASA